MANPLRHGMTCCFLWALSLPLIAQQSLPQLTRIEEGEANIRLDGFIDEAVWDRIPVFDRMKVIEPDTLADAPYETHIRVFYTEDGIYAGVINYQPPGTLVARMTPRDISLPRDGLSILLDASGEGLYGYRVKLNLGDSVSDMSILPERQMNVEWDGSWEGRTQVIDGGWSAEIFIPWSMMALPRVEAVRRIGLAFERQVGHLGGERWSTPPLPATANAYLSGTEIYELRDIEPRRQLTIYPFASTVFDGIKDDVENKVGTDIYWRPTTNTLLSATLNPDFGTVESDDVEVNLTAFETFFPEKRTFFLEGQDIFNTSPRSAFTGGGGPRGPISLLNTRRIGGAARFDVSDDIGVVPTDLSRPTDLLGAIKFTGQRGNLRYGTLLASEDDSQLRGSLDDGTQVNLRARGRDFSIFRLLYEDTSSGGRRSVGWMGTKVEHPDIDATVNAIDLHFFSADNKWVIDGQVMHSDVNGITGSGFLGDVGYTPRRGVQHTLAATYIDDQLELNNLGFLTRNDQMNLDYGYSLTESDVPGLRQRSTSFSLVNQWNTDGLPVQMGVIFSRGYTSLESNDLTFGLRFFPARIDDRLGRGTGDFKIPERWSLSIDYRTDLAKTIAYNIGLSATQDDLGPSDITTSAGVGWRTNDSFSIDMSLSYNDREALLVHRGDGRYTSFESHQWAPRLEVNYFITARQQLRFSTQWTALKAFEDRFWQVDPKRRKHLRPVANPDTTPDDFVISRLTFQARYRWEIAPLSDLFVVYTRGGNLPGDSFATFQDLLEQSWNDRIVDSVAIKLRYRFGS